MSREEPVLEVDLNEYPVDQMGLLTILPDRKAVITFGDLHGSIPRLANALVSFGFWEIGQDSYLNLLGLSWNLANSQRYTEGNKADISSDLQFFINILNASIFYAKPALVLRFIGDVFADRGSNDYLTLLILEKLVDAGVELRFTFGNHEIDFVSFVEALQLRCIGGRDEMTRSLRNLEKLIKLKLLTKESVVQLYQKIVAPRWELWGCDFDPDSTDEVGDLSVHAAALVPSLFSAANSLGVFIPAAMEEMTRGQLNVLIDGLNAAFRQRATELGLLSDGSPVSIRRIGRGLRLFPTSSQIPIPTAHPFAHITWNRRVEFDEYKQTQLFLQRLNLRVLIGHVDPEPTLCLVDGSPAPLYYCVLATQTGKSSRHMKGPIRVGFSSHAALPENLGGYSPVVRDHNQYLQTNKNVCKNCFSVLLSEKLVKTLPSRSKRWEEVKSGLSNFLAVFNLSEASQDFPSSWQRAKDQLLAVLRRDRTSSARGWRLFKAVVVNALLVLAVIATLGAAALAFVARRNQTGCPWFYAQTGSADRFFPVYKQMQRHLTLSIGSF